jgi:thiamine transport system substrate-binding protein
MQLDSSNVRRSRRAPLVRAVAAGALVALVAASCSSSDEVDQTSLTLVTHDSFALSEDVLAGFTESTGITVEIVRASDAGSMLNQSILAGDNPLGDVIFGIDNTFMSRAIGADIVESYDAPRLANIGDEFKLDATNALLPVDVGDVCLNYDTAWFADRGIDPPATLADLALPQYQDLLVVQHPATSSPGLAFMMATIAEFGTDGDYTWLDYWAELRSNGVLVSPGWSEAYYGDFTYAGGGTRPIVVSYASSPPAEVFFADPRPAEAPTAVVESTCFRQIEFVGILAGTDNRSGAEQFVDFMLSVEVQNDIPWNMFVFPVASDATPPPEFVEFSVVPANPLTVAPDEIEANRDTWIDQWAATVTR